MDAIERATTTRSPHISENILQRMCAIDIREVENQLDSYYLVLFCSRLYVLVTKDVHKKNICLFIVYTT